MDVKKGGRMKALPPGGRESPFQGNASALLRCKQVLSHFFRRASLFLIVL